MGLLFGQKPGANGFSRCDIIEYIGIASVGNDHGAACRRCDLGGFELGGHTAAAKAGAGGVSQSQDGFVQTRYQRNGPGIGETVGIPVKQSVDVRKQHQQISVDHRSYSGRKRVVISDNDLFRGNGIVFVDNGQGARSSSLDRVLEK